MEKQITKSTDDESLALQSMTFLYNNTIKAFIGVSIMPSNKSFGYQSEKLNEVALNNNQGPSQEIVAFDKSKYLKQIKVWKYNNIVNQINFVFANMQTHQIIDTESVVGEKLDESQMEMITSENGKYLNIFNLTYGATSYQLSNFSAIQCLLPAFRPEQLQVSIMNSNTNYVLNYSGMVGILDILPPTSEVKDAQFKELYMGLRETIEKVKLCKKYISDTQHDAMFFAQSLAHIFEEILRKVGPTLDKQGSKFRAQQFPKEKEKLDRNYEELQTILGSIKQLQPKINQMRSLCQHVSELRAVLFGADYVKQALRMYSGEETLEKIAEKALEDLYKNVTKNTAEVGLIKERIPFLEDEIKFYQLLKEEMEKKCQTIEKSSTDSTEQALNNMQNLLNSTTGNSTQGRIDQLKSQHDSFMKNIDKSYLNKQAKLEERIEKERDKIQSGTMSVSSSGPKKHHFIFVLDESGSMSGAWGSVIQTFNKFIEPFKNSAQQSQSLFSVILFDHSARMQYKRFQPKDIQPLPQMSGGGTTYTGGLAYAQQLVAVTPADETAVILFMTDGASGGSDVQQSKKILQSIFSGKNGMFFAIGFGYSYDRSVLQQLASAANGGKQSVQIGPEQYQFVLEAVSEKELSDIYTGLSQSFDKSAQESAIDALSRQYDLDKIEYAKNVEFYEKEFQIKLKNFEESEKLNQKITQQAQQKDIEAIKLLSNQTVKDIRAQIIDYSEEIKKIQEKKNEQEANQKMLEQLIEQENKKISNQKQEVSKQAEQQEKIKKEKSESISYVCQNSCLQDLEGVRSLFTQLGNVEGTIEALNQSVKNTKNFLLILEQKLTDLISKFGEQIDKVIIKNTSEVEIAEKLYAKYKLDNSYEGKGISEILDAVLKKQVEKHYSKYEKFYEELLKRIDLIKVTLCKKGKLKKFARLYAKKIQPKEKKIKDDSDTDSDSGSNSDDDNNPQSTSKEKTRFEDIAKDYVIIEDPKFKHEIIENLDAIDKKLSKLKKKYKKESKEASKDQKALVKSKYKSKRAELTKLQTLYKTLLDENLLEEEIETCLRNIHDIMSSVMSNTIQERSYQDFKIIFNFIGSNIVGKIQDFEQSTRLLLLENPSDIKRAVQEVEAREMKNSIERAQQEVQAITTGQQPNGNVQVNMIEY